MKYDLVIVGGGFYGTVLAYHAKLKYKNLKIVLIEKESELFTRASSKNQARVHNGFHYPRSVVTAYRSRVNYERFMFEFSGCIHDSFKHYYAIAANDSKVTPESFEQFCKFVGLSYELNRDARHTMFEATNISAVYNVTEPVFNHTLLKELISSKLTLLGIETLCNCTALSVNKNSKNQVELLCKYRTREEIISSKLAINCTYANLPSIGSKLRTQLRYELAEIAYCRVPSLWANKGFTIVDGPFCSSLPYPAKKLHSLTHVRHTPHASWTEYRALDSLKNVTEEFNSSAPAMLRDTMKFVPAYKEAEYISSHFEVKAILKKNDHNDGRPILFERDQRINKLYHVLGGKLDNIYDVSEYLNQAILEATN